MPCTSVWPLHILGKCLFVLTFVIVHLRNLSHMRLLNFTWRTKRQTYKTSYRFKYCYLWKYSLSHTRNNELRTRTLIISSPLWYIKILYEQNIFICEMTVYNWNGSMTLPQMQISVISINTIINWTVWYV